MVINHHAHINNIINEQQKILNFDIEKTGNSYELCIRWSDADDIQIDGFVTIFVFSNNRIKYSIMSSVSTTHMGIVKNNIIEREEQTNVRDFESILRNQIGKVHVYIDRFLYRHYKISGSNNIVIIGNKKYKDNTLLLMTEYMEKSSISVFKLLNEWIGYTAFRNDGGNTFTYTSRFNAETTEFTFYNFEQLKSQVNEVYKAGFMMPMNQ